MAHGHGGAQFLHQTRHQGAHTPLTFGAPPPQPAGGFNVFSLGQKRTSRKTPQQQPEAWRSGGGAQQREEQEEEPWAVELVEHLAAPARGGLALQEEQEYQQQEQELVYRPQENQWQEYDFNNFISEEVPAKSSFPKSGPLPVTVDTPPISAEVLGLAKVAPVNQEHLVQDIRAALLALGPEDLGPPTPQPEKQAAPAEFVRIHKQIKSNFRRLPRPPRPPSPPRQRHRRPKL